MKHTTKVYAALIGALSLSLITISSCQKGEKGDPGPAGQNGTNGTNGVDGNANVIGTNTVTLNPSDRTITSGVASAHLSVPGITQEVFDKGAVMVYYKASSTQWTALPYLLSNVYIVYGFKVGDIELVASTTNGTAVTINGALTFRAVIIPAKTKLSHPRTDWNNYNEVEKLITADNLTRSN